MIYRLVAGLLSVTAVAACSNDATAPASTAATPSEVSEMLSAFVAAKAFWIDPATFHNEGPNVAIASSNRKCPQGGFVQSSGVTFITVLNADTSAFVLDGTVLQTFGGCQSTGSGVVYRFDGSSISVGIHYELRGFTGRPDIYSVHERGAVNWSSGSRSGTCQLDFIASFANDAYTFSGTLCGLPVGPG